LPVSTISGNARIAIWGQSNALGRAEISDISASPLSSDTGLATFIAGTFERVYIWTGSVYAQLQTSNNWCDANQFGPEFGLAVRWMRETSSGNLYIEKWASSGVSIDNNMFKGGVWPFTSAVSERVTADAWLSTRSITLSHNKWLWEQGETDGMNEQTQSWYQTRLDQLIDDLATYNLVSATDQKLLTQMASGTNWYRTPIVDAKNAVAATAPTYIQTFNAMGSGYMKADNEHQNGRGIVQLAYDAFERFFGADHIPT
jgi:hypothetical protein